MSTSLELILVLLAGAVLAVAAIRLAHLPPLLGYLIVGALVGPHALRWIPDSADARHLAEFGVVFLMFSIGLEFSLPQLKQMQRMVFGLGSAQVASCMLLTLPALWLLGLSWPGALVLAGAFAMSSTAIVSRMLTDSMELDTRHGREIIGILLFQDLAVVPLLVIIPTLARPGVELAPALAWAAAKAAALLVLLLFVGQRLMRGWFHLVAARQSPELFMLNLLLVTLGLAWLTDRFGLSMALGAFVAGVLISETEYRHQVEVDIKPFRDVLLGLFFVTLGMRLDLRLVVSSLGLVMFLTAVPVLFKFALVALLSRGFGGTAGSSIRTGLALAQAGEFGFVLMQAGDSLIGDEVLAQAVSAAMLLSMLFAPLLIKYSDKLALRWSSAEFFARSMQLTTIAARSIATKRHVVICGYGRNGQSVARLLASEKVPYVALDLDPQRVREATAAGDSVVYGDAGRRETLIAAGLLRASALVLTYADTRSALVVLDHVRALSPALPVVVRTRDDTDLDRLIAAGAIEVVPETFESSLMLGTHTLVLLGVPLRHVIKRIRDLRQQRYRLIRGFFHGSSDDLEGRGDAGSPRLHSIELSVGAYAVGRTLAELMLDSVDVRGLRRQRRPLDLTPELRLEGGDVVVLLGVPAALAAAEIRLLQGA